eukprot:3937714-Rhodomonas_salina.1
MKSKGESSAGGVGEAASSSHLADSFHKASGDSGGGYASILTNMQDQGQDQEAVRSPPLDVFGSSQVGAKSVSAEEGVLDNASEWPSSGINDSVFDQYAGSTDMIEQGGTVDLCVKPRIKRRKNPEAHDPSAATPVVLNTETLKKHFHLPLTAAATKIGVCTTALKQ